jgi:hypothetical protein
MKRAPAALLLLCLIAAAGWWWWTHTPTYAVQQAAGAVKSHSLVNFHYWVDVNSVGSAAVDDLLSEPLRGTGSEVLGRIVGLAVIAVFKPNIVDSMDHQIDRWVSHNPKRTSATDGQPSSVPAPENTSADEDDDTEAAPPRSLLGTLVALVKPPSLKTIFKEYGLTKQNYRGLGSTDTADHVAHVGLKFFSPKAQREVEIKLELGDASGHWQIMRIANLQQTVLTITGN